MQRLIYHGDLLVHGMCEEVETRHFRREAQSLGSKGLRSCCLVGFCAFHTLSHTPPEI